MSSRSTRIPQKLIVYSLRNVSLEHEKSLFTYLEYANYEQQSEDEVEQEEQCQEKIEHD